MPEENVMWGIVELMGHAQTSGRLSRPADFGGLLRVDVPIEDGFRTEFYGMAAIYSVKITNEEIARAYARPARSVIAYDTPIVTREQHQSVVGRLEDQVNALRDHIAELERRLTSVRGLPSPKGDDEEKIPF